MSASKFYTFPADRAVLVIHDLFGDSQEGTGQIAVVAPSLTPGVSHVGIVEARGRWWRFAHGPACVKTSKAWRWLKKHDECWPYYNAKDEEPESNLNTPAANLDDFIELVTGKGGAR